MFEIPDSPEIRQDLDTLKRDGFLMSGWNTHDSTEESRAEIRKRVKAYRGTPRSLTLGDALATHLIAHAVSHE